MFTRRKGRVILVVGTISFCIWLVVSNVQNNSRIKVQSKTIDSLTVELTQSLSNISALQLEIGKKTNLLSVLKKTVEHSESENDSLVLAINEGKAKLAKEIANSNELKKNIASLEDDLVKEKNEKYNAKQFAANIQAKYDNAKSFEPILKDKDSELEAIRRSFAPRVGIFASCIATPDCEALYKIFKPFMPKVCDQQIALIYGNDGKNIREIARKLNCPDLENLYLFIIACGLDPKTASIEDVRDPFRQTIISGDFARIATATFGCDKSTVERAIEVCKHVFKI